MKQKINKTLTESFAKAWSTGQSEVSAYIYIYMDEAIGTETTRVVCIAARWVLSTVCTLLEVEAHECMQITSACKSMQMRACNSAHVGD